MAEPKILVLHGPNLNMIGKREPEIYGSTTIDEINAALTDKAYGLGFNIEIRQSNHEGELVDWLNAAYGVSDGIIINPGALTHYGMSLRDALSMHKIPIVEVHISNIHAREEWRSKSVISPVATGQIAGLGWRGYILALDFLAQMLLGH